MNTQIASKSRQRAKRGPLPQPSLRTAHDVRRLRVCILCSQLGDEREMIGVPGHVYGHGRCYIAQFGLAQLLKLPKDQLARLTLGDIGPDAAKAILELPS